MEVDEFKLLWNNSLLTEKKATVKGTDLDLILNHVLEKVNRLTIVSKFWWTLSTIGIGLVFALLLIIGIIYMQSPELLESLKNAVPALILLPTSVTSVAIFYHRQARIFDVHNCSTLSIALHQSIVRFRNWYLLSLIMFAILLSPVYYLLIAGVSYKFNFVLSTTYQVVLSGILTVLTLIFNHLQYKRTYFHWIGQLENNIEELASKNQ